jgi:1,4-dihydroxy-6-naphthoate synthase
MEGRIPVGPDEHSDHGVTEEPLLLAFSPCPNDTFVFHAWVTGLVPGAPPVTPRLDDIDMLNTLALEARPDVAKISFAALGHVRERYALLHSGGALGRGCGPLLVVPRDSELAGGGRKGDRRDVARRLQGVRVAIPGPLTTAALLLGLFAPDAAELVVMPYDRIMPAVAAGEVAAGLIIHESRFTYPQHGLELLVDLGAWWEETTTHPVPLGCVVVRRDLGRETAQAVEAAVRSSLQAAWRDPLASWPYVRRHAQELEATVCEAHIELYVTDFSLDYGREGEAAIRHLLATAEGLGLIPASGRSLFWDEE